MASPSEEVKVKKASLPSRKDVDAKFLSRGVFPHMIRDATGVEKMEVAKLRSLLAIFEEAHDRNWNVANGPWAHAVEFYQVFFQVTLPGVEIGPRDFLINDFLKRCWSILRERESGQTEPTSVIDVSATSDLVLTTEVAAPSTEASGSSHPPKASIVVAVGTQQPVSPLATSTPAKSVPRTEAEEEAAYTAHVAQLAEYRAREIAELNSDIAKIEKDREAALAVQKRERLERERRELERVAEENFVNEKKRRLDRLGELERDKLQFTSKFGQGGGDRDREG